MYFLRLCIYIFSLWKATANTHSLICKVSTTTAGSSYTLIQHMDYSSDSAVESSEVLQGSESGWTMYLNSPAYGSQDDQSSFDEKKKDGFSGGSDQEDDSMASDASSGPSRPDAADCESPKRHYVQDATTSSPKISCTMKKKNIRREERLRRQVNHSQKLVSNAATSFSRIRCRNKVTKNNVG